jgi:hypothetical protein
VTGRGNATVYNQHQYDAEKGRALEVWDRELARIIAGAAKAGAAVVPSGGTAAARCRRALRKSP